MENLLEETPQERVDRLEKELEQAKKELKTNVKVWIVVFKISISKEVYTIDYYDKEIMPNFVIGEPAEDGDLVIDIIEREYSI